jgi:hypothetical protein
METIKPNNDKKQNLAHEHIVFGKHCIFILLTLYLKTTGKHRHS